MYEIWICLILIIIFSTVAILIRWIYATQYNIYKNINTGEYYQLLAYRKDNLLYLRAKRKFLFLYFEKITEDDYPVTDNQLELNYVKVR